MVDKMEDKDINSIINTHFSKTDLKEHEFSELERNTEAVWIHESNRLKKEGYESLEARRLALNNVIQQYNELQDKYHFDGHYRIHIERGMHYNPEVNFDRFKEVKDTTVHAVAPQKYYGDYCGEPPRDKEED